MANKVVAIDVKTSKRSFDGDNKAMHMLSAFACKLSIVHSLKGNQGSLNDYVKLAFENPASNMTFYCSEDSDKSHGRIEIKMYKVSSDITWLLKLHLGWKNHRSIVGVSSTRYVNGATQEEKCYYIISLPAESSLQHCSIENSLH